MTIDPEKEPISRKKIPIFPFIAGVLMIVGLILSFFYIHFGGGLVGLAVGISFFEELRGYFFHAREYATVEGIFKTLMLVGLLLYLLLAATFFVIMVVVGFLVMTLFHLRDTRV